MFLYGKNSVLERLKANPKSIKNIYLRDNFTDDRIENLIIEKRLPARRVSQSRLRNIKQADSLGGIVAQVDEFEYTDITDLLQESEEKKLSLIFLDRIFDPQNLGAMIRSAACFGGFGIVIPKHKACRVTDTVLHVAQGAENFVPVAMVSNLTNTLLQAKKAGYWIAGAITQEGKDINNTTLPFPICCVLGSEGSGIRYGVKKYLDLEVHIPMHGAPLSLNVSGACAVLCYEITRQKGGLDKLG